jgi:hypothetical protein
MPLELRVLIEPNPGPAVTGDTVRTLQLPLLDFVRKFAAIQSSQNGIASLHHNATTSVF